MQLLLCGIFDKEVEDRVQPSWKKVSDLDAGVALWEGGEGEWEVVVGKLVSCSVSLFYQKESLQVMQDRAVGQDFSCSLSPVLVTSLAEAKVLVCVDWC